MPRIAVLRHLRALHRPQRRFAATLVSASGAGAALLLLLTAGAWAAESPAPRAAAEREVAAAGYTVRWDDKRGLPRLLAHYSPARSAGAALPTYPGLPVASASASASAAAAAMANTTAGAPAEEAAANAALGVCSHILFGGEEVEIATVAAPAPGANANAVHSLRTVRIAHSAAGVHVWKQQLLRGVPVDGAYVQVNLDLRGEPVSIGSSWRPDLLLSDAAAAITPAQAIAAALRTIDRPGAARAMPVAELIVDATSGTARLAYRTTVPLWAPLGDWVSFVDARSGQVLRTEDRMLRCSKLDRGNRGDGSDRGFPARARVEMAPPAGAAAAQRIGPAGLVVLPEPGAQLVARGALFGMASAADADADASADAAADAAAGAAGAPSMTAVPQAVQVTGSGMVFPANPLNGHPERYFLRDGANMDAFRESKPLARLDGTGLLRGSYVDAQVPAPLTRALEPTQTFEYTAEVAKGHFQEVNVYWHIDTRQDYLQSQLGLLTANNRRTTCIVHGIEDDNSFYSQATLSITYGDGGVDDSDDGEVVLHEYGHAIHDNIIPGWDHVGETGALGEAFGDYNAASFGNNALVAEWDATSYNPGPPPFLRRTDTSKVYPADLVHEIHTDGEIMSAAFWDLRGRTDATIADRIIVSSFFYMPFDPQFLDARDGAVQADVQLYGGTHVPDIYAAFSAHGIGLPYDLTLQHTPLGFTENVAGPYPVAVTIRHSSPISQATAVKALYHLQGAPDFSAVTLGTAGGDLWTGALPGPGAPATIEYYLVATDDAGVTRTEPALAPAQVLSFAVGPDTQAPTIVHAPLLRLSPQIWPPTLRAQVTDNFGVQSVQVEWSFNGNAQSGFALAHASGDLYQGTFPGGAVSAAVGDVIAYSIRATDSSAAGNQRLSGPHTMQIVQVPATVLVLDDDAIAATARGAGKTLATGAADIAGALNGAGFLALVEDAAQSIPSTWPAYDVLVSSSGSSSAPLSDAAYRQAVVDYVNAGGKLVVEGGEVGHRAIAQGYTDVVQHVLHVTGWLGDDSGPLVARPDRDYHPILTTPHALPAHISLSLPAGAGDQDALAPASDAYVVCGTHTQHGAAGLLVYDNDASPATAQIVVLAAAWSRIADPLVADDLMENIITYLRAPEGPATAAVAGNVHLSGAADHSGVSVRLEPTGQSLVTGTDGAFALQGLYPGAYRIVAAGPAGWETKQQTITLSAGQAVIGLQLRLRQEVALNPCVAPAIGIPDNAPSGVTSNVVVSEVGDVGDVNCFVNIAHPSQGDLIVELVSPTGQTVRLHDRSGVGVSNLIAIYDDEDVLPPDGPGTLADLYGAPANGTWTLRVIDAITGGTGQLLSWCVTVRVLKPDRVPVLASGLQAEQEGQGVRVSWTVQDPSGAVGFRLLRSVGESAFEPLAPRSPLPGGQPPAGDLLPATVGVMSFLDPAAGVAPGTALAYRLQVVWRSGAVETLQDEARLAFAPPLPRVYSLAQNAPNPFNPVTRIAFALPRPGRTTLRIYDLAGRLVATLVDEVLAAGDYERVWNGHDGRGAAVASGTYVYELRSWEFAQTRHMTLLK